MFSTYLKFYYDIQYKNLLGFPLKTIHFCVLIHCSADCCLSLKQFAAGICLSPQKTWFENNRKISITKEICITIDSPQKIPERKSDSEAGCIFENFTPKQGDSLKILAAGTRNHGVSLPPPPRVSNAFIQVRILRCHGNFIEQTLNILYNKNDMGGAAFLVKSGVSCEF